MTKIRTAEINLKTAEIKLKTEESNASDRALGQIIGILILVIFYLLFLSVNI